MLLPLGLIGCGSAGNSTALKNSAHLTPPPLQENQRTAAISAGQSLDVATNKTAPSAKTSSPEAKKALASKASGTAGPIVAAKVDAPPIPVRRPYRKVRKKSAARMVKHQDPAIKIADKMITRSVVKPKIQAKAQPVIVAPVIAKAPKVEMVPAKSVPAQTASNESSELIFGGYIDGSGINASQELSAQELNTAQMAQAKSVANKPSFGQSEYRFSGQK